MHHRSTGKAAGRITSTELRRTFLVIVCPKRSKGVTTKLSRETPLRDLTLVGVTSNAPTEELANICPKTTPVVLPSKAFTAKLSAPGRHPGQKFDHIRVVAVCQSEPFLWHEKRRPFAVSSKSSPPASVAELPLNRFPLKRILGEFFR